MDRKCWLFAVGKRGHGIVPCYASKSLDQFGCWQTTPHKAKSTEIDGGANGKDKQWGPAVIYKNICLKKQRNLVQFHAYCFDFCYLKCVNKVNFSSKSG